MDPTPRSPVSFCSPRPPVPYPLDETFVRALKIALHERDPQQFFPELANELLNSREISQLNRFFLLIPQMPDLYRNGHPAYEEALNEALLSIDKRLTDFQCDWEKDSATNIRWRFIRWLNGQLRYRVKDLYRREARWRRGENILSLDCAIARGNGEVDQSSPTLGETIPAESVEGLTLSGLDHTIDRLQQQNTQRHGLLVELYIEHDPDSALKGCHARKTMQLNCQEVAQKIFLRLWGGKVGKLAAEKKLSWRSLAEQLEVKEQTVHSHWKRRCLPLLKKISQKIEAQSDFYAKRLLGPDFSPDTDSVSD
ncbi:MAG: hypothetical protein AAF889_09605 [Cyanobacteria bacterium P01_D01_bin.73]